MAGEHKILGKIGELESEQKRRVDAQGDVNMVWVRLGKSLRTTN